MRRLDELAVVTRVSLRDRAGRASRRKVGEFALHRRAVNKAATLAGVAYATGHRSHVAERSRPTPDAVTVFFPCVETSRLVLADAASKLLRAIGGETREAAALRQAAEIAATATPHVDPLQRILESALRVLPADHLVLLHVTTDRMESVIVAATGTAEVWRWLRAPLRPGIAARAIETGDAQLVSDAVGHAGASRRQPTCTVLVVPVILRGNVLGVLETADERGRFTGRHVKLLRAFADQCAIAIDNARGGRTVRA